MSKTVFMIAPDHMQNVEQRVVDAINRMSKISIGHTLFSDTKEEALENEKRNLSPLEDAYSYYKVTIEKVDPSDA